MIIFERWEIMNLLSFRGKFVRVYLHAMRVLDIASLQFHNLFSRKSLIGEGKVVVSLTTYGLRISSVHLGIESIARGFLLPRRVILWLDDQAVIDNPPRALLRLKKRGLELRFCPNYGPHKKYYPYIDSLSFEAALEPLVIADDDMIYSRTWLSGLLDSYRDYPEAVSCTRAHELQIDEFPTPYSEWPACHSDKPSVHTFATGVGGVLYPPAAQFAIKSFGKGFEKCAPRADDIWLHYVTVSSGILIRQILPESLDLEFKILPFGQGTALHTVNVGLSANDEQISSTYDEPALAILRNS
jgi:hypothetical protein